MQSFYNLCDSDSFHQYSGAANVKSILHMAQPHLCSRSLQQGLNLNVNELAILVDGSATGIARVTQLLDAEQTL
mgnify:CR=1 FL=1